MSSRTSQEENHCFKESIFIPLHRIFTEYANAENEWDKEQTAAFFQYSQAAGDVAHYLLTEKMDLTSFLRYMASTEANGVIPLKPEDDMTWPLNSYFVSSSHNTYLTGNQLSSDSSTDMYKHVLQRGCRCIEIDVWDGSEHIQGDAGKEHPRKLTLAQRAALKMGMWVLDNLPNEKTKAEGIALRQRVAQLIACEPRVLHGHTLTKEVPFRSVCETVRDHAFKTSDLPILVSLEVHCTATQQQMMVDIMKETWNGLLITPPELDTEVDNPPIANLCNKILVKAKWLPNSATEVTIDDADSAYSSDPNEKDPKTPKPPKIIPALSDLAIYTRGIAFKSILTPEAEMPAHIFSLSEPKIETVFEVSGGDIFKHNKRFLMRTYPAGTRVDSSNFDPTKHWRKGVQFAALNWQTIDDGMMLNHAMFAGSSGYVLKPAGYRGLHPSTPLDGNEEMIPNHTITKLHITALAAQDIPFPPNTLEDVALRPYLVGRVYAPPHPLQPLRGSEPLHAQTRPSTGRHPDFESEVLPFNNISDITPELGFLVLRIMDERRVSDALCAWTCLRIDQLQKGLRWIRLRDAQGDESEGLLLVKVEIEWK